ncbi:MAG: NUDIX domain-containing protein [Candidatus Aenigmatarchaeota archaeon]
MGLPNGKVKLGEKLEDATKREVKEETGLSIKVLKPYLITQEFHDNHHHLVIAFKGKIIGGKLKAGSDASEAKWFSIKEVKKLKIQPTAKLQIKSS